ncbi:MAG: hypothetical protein AAGD38_10365 [Acidobacteriota bacterium]
MMFNLRLHDPILFNRRDARLLCLLVVTVLLLATGPAQAQPDDGTSEWGHLGSGIHCGVTESKLVACGVVLEFFDMPKPPMTPPEKPYSERATDPDHDDAPSVDVATATATDRGAGSTRGTMRPGTGLRSATSLRLMLDWINVEDDESNGLDGRELEILHLGVLARRYAKWRISPITADEHWHEFRLHAGGGLGLYYLDNSSLEVGFQLQVGASFAFDRHASRSIELHVGYHRLASELDFFDVRIGYSIRLPKRH